MQTITDFSGYLTPIVVTVLAWWASTGVVLWLINRPVSTHRLTGAISTAIAAVAMVGVYWLRDRTGLADAYLGFFVGVVLWGWHEVLFLLGFVSGPRRTPCPPGLSPLARFKASTEAILHHECGIAIHALVIVGLSVGAPNSVAALTFLIFWGMRVSAKLLVFFGAPNLSDDFLPVHLRYLTTYFRKEPHLPSAVSALLITAAAAASMVFMVRDADPGMFAHTVLVLLTTLTTLALFEHVALVVRLPDRLLFSWILRPSQEEPKTTLSTGRTTS